MILATTNARSRTLREPPTSTRPPVTRMRTPQRCVGLNRQRRTPRPPSNCAQPPRHLVPDPPPLLQASSRGRCWPKREEDITFDEEKHHHFCTRYVLSQTPNELV